MDKRIIFVMCFPVKQRKKRDLPDIDYASPEVVTLMRKTDRYFGQAIQKALVKWIFLRNWVINEDTMLRQQSNNYYLERRALVISG